MRRLIVSIALAYQFVAFGFILLTLLNASDQDGLVVIGESDAGVVVTMSAIGVLVTITLGLRLLIDGQRLRRLEQQERTPRRRSDITRSGQ